MNSQGNEESRDQADKLAQVDESDWHAIDEQQALERVSGSPDGLDGEEAQRRRQDVGPNSLEEKEGVGPLRILLRQVNNPLIYLLIGAAILSLVAGRMVDAGVIAGVVLLNSVLGFVQEWRAEGALAALREMTAPQARVLRGGEGEDIPSEDVVPGDVLVLESGDRVVADARVLSAEDLRVDESALTGESEPAEKSPGTLDDDTPMGDRSNMVWMSTSVTSGRGQAVVVETGMRTQMGSIAGDVRSAGRQKTPLQKRMQRMGIILAVAGAALAGLMFVVGLARDYPTLDILLFSVAVAVAAIPEGLPAVITVTLALGVKRMARRHAIIRRLPAVETLGSTTVICTDKTGTITENQMTVRRIWADGRSFTLSGEGYQPEGTICDEEGAELDEQPEALQQLLRVAALVNNAQVTQEDDRWQVEGDPSEGALLVAAQKGGLDPDALRDEVERVDEVPFSSELKYMATLHPAEEGSGRVALVKGAPDRLLEFCTHILIDGDRVELDDKRRNEVKTVNEQLAADAMRVMAGACREIGGDKDELDEGDVEQGLTLLGLWGMIDPPRQESAPAVAAARQAGIRPVLLTGDFAATAVAIAKQVGIVEGGEALTASDVEHMEEAELAEATLERGVFARVSPRHKLKIMDSLRNRGEVVAMTGDGVNDAPALKGADIGVAMGRAGTQVAREAADMVLTDDNFATIVHAVEEGRTIYGNLRNVTFFLLAQNGGELLTLGAALVLGLELPLTAVMILWVNMITSSACTVPLGVEPRHSDVLREKPRGSGENLINKPLLRRLAILAPIMAIGTLGLFHYTRMGESLAKAQTVAFSAMVAFEWFQALNARSQYQSVFSIGLASNRWLLLGLGVAIALQVLVVHTPPGQWLFHTTHLGVLDWLLIMLVASSIWIADEVLKRLGVHGRPPGQEGD
jgi:Ca2+-transporting ATPase